MTTEAEFWAKVDKRGPDECWKWLGANAGGGYGAVYFAGRGWRAHRVAYELAVGPIPEGLQLDHLCRNRACVNPVHLEPVTSRENTMRSPIAVTAVNARKTHCDYGHEFTEANTLTVRKGERECHQCRLGYRRKWREPSLKIHASGRGDRTACGVYPTTAVYTSGKVAEVTCQRCAKALAKAAV